MRYAILAAAALLPALAPAAENRRDVSIDSTAEIGRPTRPTSRTLLDVVALAIAEGTDVNINPDVAGSLGLRPDLRLRVLRYRARHTADHLEREFQVAYKRGRHGAIEPVGVLFDVAEVSLADAVKSVRATTLLLDLEGGLQKAAGREGAFKSVAHGALPKDKVGELYKGELEFYEKGSLGLPVER